MPTMCFLSLLLFFFSAACASGEPVDRLRLASGSTLRYVTEAGKTRFELQTALGARSSIVVTRDATVSPKSPPANVKIVGETKESNVFLIDTYPSIPGGMSYCKAGEERFLRVLEVADKQLKELHRLKVESCRDNLELASPGIEFQPETRTLKVEWLQGPTVKGKSEAQTIRMMDNGKISVQH